MYRKNSIGKKMLAALEKTVDGYVRLEDFLYNPGYYAYWGGWSYPLKKSALSLVLKRLRENGMVELVSDKELVLRLTDKGREKAVLQKINLEDSPWDGKYRLVIFDVPEKRRIARDVLRFRLKEWGFVPWQQSVWVTKKNCTKVLREYIRKVGIEDWVIVVESDNVGRNW